MHKLKAIIHEDKLTDFEHWFTESLSGKNNKYMVDGFEQDPHSTGVLYTVSIKLSRQADVALVKNYLGMADA